MTVLGELRLEAVQENLRTISYFIQGVGNRLNLSGDSLFALELAIEEACTNVVTHAYPDKEKGQVELRVKLLDNDRLQITIVDWGKPLDESDVQPYDRDAPIESRIRGGMGLHLIANLMEKVERRRFDNANQLILIQKIKRSVRRERKRQPSREVQELSAMRTVTEFMSTGMELDKLLYLIIDKLVETVDADRGTLFLIDERAGELWSKVFQERQEEGIREIRFPIGEGIAGQVAQKGESLNILDAYAHPLFNPEVDKKTGYRTRTILTVPMRNPQQKIIGVVQLLNKKGGTFGARDERILTAMAAQAAISIETNRLYAQELQQQLLKRELDMAHQIQQSFLPESLPQNPGWDIASYWAPIHNVAGDFYDFHTLPDGRMAVDIADVSGHGVPSALFMALTVTVIRFAMNSELTPSEVLKRANDLIVEKQRSKLFATVFLVYIDLDNGELNFASAGHNPPILYRAATGECEYLEISGVALGVFGDGKFLEKSLDMDEDDILVLYTDGITEIVDEDDDEFGEERLEELITQNADKTADELTRLIIQTVNRFAGNEGIFDDETLVIIKRQPG